MVMDAGMHELCTLLPGSKNDGHLPIYPQIGAVAATNGFTADELEALLFMPPDGMAAAPGGGSGYLNVAPTTVVPPAVSTNGASPPRDAAAAGQVDEAFSDITLGYINRVLMAEDIDEKFEHYPEHGALLAAEKPFLEILTERPASSGGSAVDSPDGSSITNSCSSLGSCGCAAAASDARGALRTPVLDFPSDPFLQPPQLYRDLSPDSSVVEAGDAWPYDPTEPQSSSNGSGVTVSDGFESLLSSPGFVPDVGFTEFAVQDAYRFDLGDGLRCKRLRRGGRLFAKRGAGVGSVVRSGTDGHGRRFALVAPFRRLHPIRCPYFILFTLYFFPLYILHLYPGRKKNLTAWTCPIFRDTNGGS